MALKKKIVIGILTVVCGVQLLFAFEIFMVANNGQLLPMMEESIGKTTAEVDQYSPELLQFIFTPIKVTAALLFSLNVGILLLLYFPFRKNREWAAIPLFSLLFLWLLPAIYFYSQQPGAPWQIWAGLLFLVLLALGLYLSRKKTG